MMSFVYSARSNQVGSIKGECYENFDLFNFLSWVDPDSVAVEDIGPEEAADLVRSVRVREPRAIFPTPFLSQLQQLRL
jgi:hypothetical protein